MINITPYEYDWIEHRLKDYLTPTNRETEHTGFCCQKIDGWYWRGRVDGPTDCDTSIFTSLRGPVNSEEQALIELITWLKGYL